MEKVFYVSRFSAIALLRSRACAAPAVERSTVGGVIGSGSPAQMTADTENEKSAAPQQRGMLRITVLGVPRHPKSQVQRVIDWLMDPGAK